MKSEAVITLDLHGKNAYQARVALEAALRRRGGAYRLRVIHGYGHNTRLKEMIFAATRQSCAWKPAITRARPIWCLGSCEK